MTLLEILFWLFLFIVFYTYAGYGILLYPIVKTRHLLGQHQPYQSNTDYEPEVTLFVAASNEKSDVAAKAHNLRSLTYLQEVEKDTLLDDFIISLRLACGGTLFSAILMPMLLRRLLPT